nr:MAG TPA: hypothetical protein [Caudoviricetes sp.]
MYFVCKTYCVYKIYYYLCDVKRTTKRKKKRTKKRKRK